jgi:hypothetical protein
VAKRFLRILMVMALVLPAQTAAAQEVTPIQDDCPVPLGRYMYDSTRISYKVRVYLANCSWYDGRPMLLRGSLVRSDGLTQGEAKVALRCQPGAPPPGDDPDDHTGHNSPIPAPPPIAQEQGDSGTPVDEVRPADNCVLAVRMRHLEVERAHYEGELTYPVEGGEFTERLSLDCISAHDVIYKCAPPGESPLAPEG